MCKENKILESREKKVFEVNWSVCGIKRIETYSEEEARQIVENMDRNELEKEIIEESKISFEIGTIEETKPSKSISEIFTELTAAVYKYGEDKVELLLVRESGIFYIHYHDRHDSHPIGNTYWINDYISEDIKLLENLCNENNFDFQDM